METRRKTHQYSSRISTLPCILHLKKKRKANESINIAREREKTTQIQQHHSKVSFLEDSRAGDPPGAVISNDGLFTAFSSSQHRPLIFISGNKECSSVWVAVRGIMCMVLLFSLFFSYIMGFSLSLLLLPPI